jgi:hypothetical protein
MKILAGLVTITILLFYFIGTIYLIRKHDGFRVFYNGLNKIFNYQGRAKRIEYACFSCLVTTITIIIDEIFSLLNNPPEIILLLIMLIFLLSKVAVTTRRLHDLGYSGWLQAPIVIINMYSYTDSSNENYNYFGFIILLIVIFSFDLYLMFKQGQPLDNQYGEKTKDEVI